MRAQTAVKVYVEGKRKPIHLGQAKDDQVGGEGTYANATLALADGGVIEGVTTDGEQVCIDAERVVSVLRPIEQCKPDAGIFLGRRVEVRSCGMLGTTGVPEDAAILADIPQERRDYSVAVIAEDMASATVLVFDLETGVRYWQNPASPERSIDLTQQAATALALAETLLVDMYEQPPVEA